MPHGYHFYRCDRFDIATREEYRENGLEVGAREVDAPFIGWHQVGYYLPKDTPVRVGGAVYSSHELAYEGYIWLGQAYAMLEIRSEVHLRLSNALSALPGVNLTRLVLPGLKDVYWDLPNCRGLNTRHPDNPDRYTVDTYGQNVRNDPRNMEQLDEGLLTGVRFDHDASPAAAYWEATITLFGGYDTPLGAARQAWEIWHQYFAQGAVPWRRGWKRAVN